MLLFTDSKELIDRIESYYTEKLKTHGPTARGVDWRDVSSQEIRFEKLTHLFPSQASFSVNDIGCGYGALFNYLRARHFDIAYCGFDISRPMIDAARSLFPNNRSCQFVCENDLLVEADFCVASGIFNVKLDFETATWERYVLEILHVMNRLGRKGFAFNILTTHSDPERMEKRLYYADPCRYFELCRREFSRQVALLHDYGLYEFTILVRKT